MPDYIFLLENRLSHDQRHALQQLREVAREAGTILFLTGDVVRDLTSGHAVRSLEVSIHGNALKLKKQIEKLGGTIWGEHAPSQTLYLCFPGTVRVDLISTHAITYPKPGKPVYQSASIQEDLRRRDFTVNAMAISLNEGSYGLLMDPLNGAADIEARILRLASNYGFIEDPSLMIRATRYHARLGWEMDPRTRTRYEDAKAEGLIEAITPHAISQELEQIGHEEEALAVLKALEAEDWMKSLFPAWTSAKADEEKLRALHDLAAELLAQGVHADTSAAQMQLLTARLQAKDLAALKSLLLRPGFVEEWNSLDTIAAAFSKLLLAKENSTPSTAYKLFTSHDPEAVLWLGFTSKSAPVHERFQQFLKHWPEVRQQIPHALMQEMRITPELANYDEIVQAVFLELIDGRLTTPEEMRAFLEPYSPPAPPPQVTIKRSRPKRSAEAKRKERSFDDEENEDDPELDDEDDLNDIDADDDEDLDPRLKHSDEDDHGDEDDEDKDDKDEEDEPREAALNKRPAKTSPKDSPVAKKQEPSKPPVAPKASPSADQSKAATSHKKVQHEPALPHVTAKAKPESAHPITKPAKQTPAAKTLAKAPAKSAVQPAKKSAASPAKAAQAKPVKAPAKVAAKAPVKVAAKAQGKTKPAPKAAKAPAKDAAKNKPASAKSKQAKPVAKKAAPKKSGKR